MSRYNPLLMAFLALTTISLACNFGIRRPETLNEPIPVSSEAVDSLEDSLQGAYQQAIAGEPVTLVIDEAQLTSMVAFELQERGDVPFEDPQVYLRDGQIQVVGKMRRQGIAVTTRVVLEAEVDDDGNVHLNVVSANFGPLPVPDSMIADMETYLDSSFSKEISAMAPNTRIENISIENGQMTITGQPIE